MERSCSRHQKLMTTFFYLLGDKAYLKMLWRHIANIYINLLFRVLFYFSKNCVIQKYLSFSPSLHSRSYFTIVTLLVHRVFQWFPSIWRLWPLSPTSSEKCWQLFLSPNYLHGQVIIG